MFCRSRRSASVMPIIAGPNGSSISINFPGETAAAAAAPATAAPLKHRNPLALPGLDELNITIGSGGTSDVLPAERAKASFDVETMTNVLDGGRAYTAKRRWIFDAHAGADVFVHAEVRLSLSRSAVLAAACWQIP